MKVRHAITLAVDLSLFGLIVWFAFSEHGPVGQRLAEWKTTRSIKEAIGRHWDSLTAAAVTIGGRDSVPALIEFVDYQCPYCRATEDTARKFQRLHPSVTVGVLQFPLSGLHPAARGAALSVICARRLGMFKELHRRLLSTTDWFLDRDWVAQAVEAGVVDSNAFRSCLASAEAESTLLRDSVMAAQLLLAGTPAWVSPNGARIGMVTVHQLENLAGVE